MADDPLRDRIDALVEEEHELRERHVGQGLDDAERERLKQLEVELDQTWDLLRRRNARREAGQDPTTESERDQTTVEGYLQ
jgi:predicted nuclease with TOPRIM domain